MCEPLIFAPTTHLIFKSLAYHMSGGMDHLAFLLKDKVKRPKGPQTRSWKQEGPKKSNIRHLCFDFVIVFDEDEDDRE